MVTLDIIEKKTIKWGNAEWAYKTLTRAPVALKSRKLVAQVHMEGLL